MGSHAAAVEELVDRVLQAAEKQTDETFSTELRDALNGFAGHPEWRQARLAIASRLWELNSPMGAGFLAIWLGGGVEEGLEPEPTVEPLLAATLKWCRLVASTESPVRKSLDTGQIATGLDYLARGLVAHLGRCNAKRLEIAARADVLEQVEKAEPYAVGASWILESLRKCSGNLLVIHPDSRRGARLKYQNISNCFHLFTLLQAALVDKLPGAKRVQAETLAAARGEQSGPTSDSAWWHYGRGDVPRSGYEGSIWGEASPSSIPEICGEQVILLWKPIMKLRQWDGGFFGPFLEAAPPDMRFIEELSDEEFEEWRQRLRIPEVSSDRPWWAFWK